MRSETVDHCAGALEGVGMRKRVMKNAFETGENGKILKEFSLLLNGMVQAVPFRQSSRVR